MDDPVLTVYTTSWCPDSRRAKAFLNRHGVPFREVDIEAVKKAARPVRRLNRGARLVPTLVFPDGSALAVPGDRALAARLGVDVEGDAEEEPPTG